MSLSVIFGVGIVMFFLLFFAFKLDDNHGVLRYAMIFFSFSLLLIIPSSIVLDETVCEVVLNSTNETYTYGNNFTGYHWDYATGTAPDGPQVDAYLFHRNTSFVYDEHCYTKSNGGSAFMSSTRWVYYVFLAYILIYLFILSIQALVTSYKKNSTKTFGWKVFKGGK